MTLLYPLGLLALIGVPVLILIYILKNKYTEQVIASTYIWELSEKFLKKRNPINKIVGIISLILQILAVVFIAFALSHPVFAIPGTANDYCFILDGSGSMNIVSNGKTRLETGKDRIASIIDKSADGCTYTLIYASDTTYLVYEDCEDKALALQLLNELAPAHTEAGFVYAIGEAQAIFEENPAVRTYLVTDKNYETTTNVELLNVSSAEENYALTDVTYSLAPSGDGQKLTVKGKAVSYETETVIGLDLYINEERRADAEKAVSVQKYSGDNATEFTFEIDLAGDFDLQRIDVKINTEDALALDNSVTLFNADYENHFNVLIVSKEPTFIVSAVKTKTTARVTTVDPAKYGEADSGYDLYIFDNCKIEKLPQDGAVWFINPQDGIEGAGFSVQGDEALGEEGDYLTYSNSTNTLVKQLLNGLFKDDIIISQYVKCKPYNEYRTLISYGAYPAVFTCKSDAGRQVVVFAFDLHDSDFAVSPDYAMLTANILGYIFPKTIEKTGYYCDEYLTVNVASDCNSIRIDTPLGNVGYLDVTLPTADYRLTEVGAYTVTVNTSSGDRVYNIFASLPEKERVVTATEASFSLAGEASDTKRAGKFEEMWIWFLIIAVLVAADWGIYCYEQYQLR